MMRVCATFAFAAVAAAAAEVYQGASFRADGTREACTLTIEKDAAGATTAVRVVGWGRFYDVAKGESFGMQELVVAEDNERPELKETVDFDREWSWQNWGFTQIASEQSRLKATTDTALWAGALMRDRRYVDVKGDIDELKARLNVYAFLRIGSIKDVEIDCIGLVRQ